jgi:hypothetical protein
MNSHTLRWLWTLLIVTHFSSTWANCDPTIGLVDADRCFPQPTGGLVDRPSPSLLLRDIANGDAARVTRLLEGTDERFAWFERSVSSGQPQWIAVAVALYEQPILPPLRQALEEMLALALPRAPARILPLVGNPLPVEALCKAPSNLRSVSARLHHIDQSERALRGLRTRRFEDAKAFCLGNLAHVKAELAAQQNVAQPPVAVDQPQATDGDRWRLREMP